MGARIFLRREQERRATYTKTYTSEFVATAYERDEFTPQKDRALADKLGVPRSHHPFVETFARFFFVRLANFMSRRSVID